METTKPRCRTSEAFNMRNYKYLKWDFHLK